VFFRCGDCSLTHPLSNLFKPMTIKTSDHYWDCNCEKEYIQSRELGYCVLCDTLQEEGPDSILEEVNQMLKDKTNERN
jgi:hypothetical protein